VIDNPDDLLAAMALADKPTPAGGYVDSQYPAQQVEIPLVDQNDIATLAAWWSEHASAVKRALTSIQDALVAHLLTGAELPGLTLSHRYTYAVDAGSEFPQLVSQRTLSLSLEDEERWQELLDLVLTAMPDAETTFDLKIDGRKANSLILADAAGAERLRQLRTDTPFLRAK
jgi:hypothetical protein